MELQNVISGEPITCDTSTSVGDAVRMMVANNIGALAVMDGGLLAGIFSERDVMRVFVSSDSTDQDPVEVWMTPTPDAVEPTLDIFDAADWLLATGYRHLPVVDGKTLVGVVSIKDILWAMSEDNRAIDSPAT